MHGRHRYVLGMGFLYHMKVAIIGGGAAGFFAALSVKEHHPDSTVHLIEKSNKTLAKVKVSGGGRCNVTSGAASTKDLLAGYPRGAKFLKKAFQIFNNQDTMEWYQSKGIGLKTEADGRVFPNTDDSQTIIDCLRKETLDNKIEVRQNMAVKSIHVKSGLFTLDFGDHEETYDKVIVATGGSPKMSGLEWLADLGHRIEPPVPSLFTFNMPNEPITSLMGLSVETALARVQGSKLSSTGPLLITHWGMSGPCILKLSAHGARELEKLDYQFNIQINWVGIGDQNLVMTELNQISQKHPAKILSNQRPFGVPERLWLFLLNKSELSSQKKWGELGKKGINKLVNVLCNDIYQVSGKTTFKEEFVTCGGVSLSDINPGSMQSRVVPGLYFAGEVMDIDGITGGYNFQAAWTTGFIAGQLG